jgi:hypothetical protein
MTKKQVESVLKKAQGLDLKNPKNTEWLAKNLAKIRTSMNPKTFIEQSETVASGGLLPGRMFFFGYNPKTKNELSFWDQFPIIVYLHPQPGGFLGINFHYLSPMMRAKFLNGVISYANDPNWNTSNSKKTRLQVSYSQLKKIATLKPYKYCIKRYYTSNIVTKLAFIPPTEWKTVPFFPLEQFKGASRETIWSLAR